MQPKGMEDLAVLSVREVKRAAGEERVVFFCRTVRIEVKSKVIQTSSLKIEERGTFVVAKHRRKRDS